MLGKTSSYSIDVSENDRHSLLFYKKCHFCHLLPVVKVGQCTEAIIDLNMCLGITSFSPDFFPLHVAFIK